jgi:hypothetical protein
MPDNKQSQLWDIIQAVASVYCAILGTVSWLFPVQPGQPLWQGAFRVNAPPGFAIALAILGSSFAIPRIRHVVRGLRKVAGGPSQADLKIHSAFYGIGNPNDIDVTKILHEAPRNALSVWVGNNLIPGIADPAPNKVKRLSVSYSFGALQAQQCIRSEHHQLVLPEDLGFIERTAAEYERKRIADLSAQNTQTLQLRPVNSEVQKQMDGLLPFSQMAIKHLVTKRGMTESYFSQLVMDMGFPTISLQQQNAIGNILPQLASNTTLLTKDPHTSQWTVKPEFTVDVINYLSAIKD